MTFIEKKIKSGDAVDEVTKSEDDEEEAAEGKVLDLASYLERSLKDAGDAKEKPKAKAKPAKKRIPAKKHVSKETSSKKARRSA